MKAATLKRGACQLRFRISIHAAREGGDALCKSVNIDVRISIHAAREGGDVVVVDEAHHASAFQSTPPVKAATSSLAAKSQERVDFNPRRP